MAAVVNWRKSRRSIAMGECVEVGQDEAVIGVRDSRTPDGPVLAFGGSAWAAFTARLGDGGGRAEASA